MTIPLEPEFLGPLEETATELAYDVGRMLNAKLGGELKVEYKDEAHRDPVTSADKEAQLHMESVIRDRFPDHFILGEEGEDDEPDRAPNSDVVWMLDPLDGTGNFLNGLPIFGSSIGVTHRGIPVAGAMSIPWPSSEGVRVFHASVGQGARIDGNDWTIPEFDESDSRGLAGLPGSFDTRYKFRKGMRGHAGDGRVFGSVVYELSMATLGVFRYALLAAPRVWDVAAGAVIVSEAGGSVLVRQGRKAGWGPLAHVGPSWDGPDQGTTLPPSVKELRTWVRPVIVGRNDVVETVAANLDDRRPLGTKVRSAVREVWRRSGMR